MEYDFVEIGIDGSTLYFLTFTKYAEKLNSRSLGGPVQTESHLRDCPETKVVCELTKRLAEPVAFLRNLSSKHRLLRHRK